LHIYYKNVTMEISPLDLRSACFQMIVAHYSITFVSLYTDFYHAFYLLSLKMEKAPRIEALNFVMAIF
jgi:hypothetical protein